MKGKQEQNSQKESTLIGMVNTKYVGQEDLTFLGNEKMCKIYNKKWNQSPTGRKPHPPGVGGWGGFPPPGEGGFRPDSQAIN